MPLAAAADGRSGVSSPRRAATAPDAGSGLDQPPGADHVVGQRVPQGDGLDLLEAAHQELRQSAIARLRVGAFRGRRALLVDVLGLVTAHALAPRGDTGLVARERRVGGAAGIARLRHRRERFDTVPRKRFDIVEPDEAAIDKMLTWPFAILPG